MSPSPIELWNEFAEEMSRDYIDLCHDTVEIAKEKSLAVSFLQIFKIIK